MVGTVVVHAGSVNAQLWEHENEATEDFQTDATGV